MGLKSDRWIRDMARRGMIDPFVDHLVREADDNARVISYGLSSYGYDLRVAPEFRVFTNVHAGVVDPKAFDPRSYVEVLDERCIIPPNGFALARSVEYFRIPDDVLGICVGKSTYARCGVVTPLTPLEPGWEGHLTLEIVNSTSLPAIVYANEGMCQLVFFQGDEPCEVHYGNRPGRPGKYQGQTGVTLPRI